MTLKSLSILGCTGSIGVNTLEIVRQFPRPFKICALAAGRDISLLKEHSKEFNPRLVSVMDAEGAEHLREALGPLPHAPRIVFGPDGYEEVATIPEAQMLVSAMVGAAGLLPTLAAIEAGKHIALANKETLVIAGEIVMERAARKGVQILPVDSEHSAIFQSLQGNHRRDLKRILLTDRKSVV